MISTTLQTRQKLTKPSGAWHKAMPQQAQRNCSRNLICPIKYITAIIIRSSNDGFSVTLWSTPAYKQFGYLVGQQHRQWRDVTLRCKWERSSNREIKCLGNEFFSQNFMKSWIRKDSILIHISSYVTNIIMNGGWTRQ